MWRAWLSNDFTLTKRHLGLILLAAGVILLAAGGIAQIVGTGGVGTVQKMVLSGGVLSILVGLTLLPLRDQPA